MKDNTIIQAEDLIKIYNDRNVLDNISLDVKKSDIILIKGKSGAGKSTLLYILGMLIRPDHGDIFFEDIKVYKNNMSKLRREKIGFMFQEFFLIEDCSVYENIILPFKLNGEEINDLESGKITSLCNEIGLPIKRLNEKVRLLSLGERARVALMRAIIRSPKLCICDEPTGNLDHENAGKIVSLIDSLNKKNEQSFLIATHSNIFDTISTHIINIEDGKAEWLKKQGS